MKRQLQFVILCAIALCILYICNPDFRTVVTAAIKLLG